MSFVIDLHVAHYDSMTLFHCRTVLDRSRPSLIRVHTYRYHWNELLPYARLSITCRGYGFPICDLLLYTRDWTTFFARSHPPVGCLLEEAA